MESIITGMKHRRKRKILDERRKKEKGEVEGWVKGGREREKGMHERRKRLKKGEEEECMKGKN